MANRRRATGRSIAVVALLLVALVAGTLAVATWAAIPANELWWLGYILTCFAALFLIALGLATALVSGVAAGVRAAGRRRDRRIKRHVDAALAHLADPPTQVIQLGAGETQLLARYDLELSDPTEQHLYPGDHR